MKTAEILRKLADLVDTVECDASSGPEETAPDELGTMVPPLQQKIEILKKSQGIDKSVFAAKVVKKDGKAADDPVKKYDEITSL